VVASFLVIERVAAHLESNLVLVGRLMAIRLLGSEAICYRKLAAWRSLSSSRPSSRTTTAASLLVLQYPRVDHGGFRGVETIIMAAKLEGEAFGTHTLATLPAP
jgi:hypothetical protein